MDPRKGKANYGEAYRQNLLSTLSENQNSQRLQFNQQHNQPSQHQQLIKPQVLIGKEDNFRIVNDPHIKPGCKKLISVNGVIAGHTEVVVMRDPRSRVNKQPLKNTVFELPTPKFKQDEHSVGLVLPRELSFFNLNNNIDREFLASLCSPFGLVEEVTIWNNSSRQHLGIGSAVFTSTKAAALCCQRLHNTPAMGKVMTVLLDCNGEVRKKKMIELHKLELLQQQQKLQLHNGKLPPQLQQLCGHNFKSPSQMNRTPVINHCSESKSSDHTPSSTSSSLSSSSSSSNIKTIPLHATQQQNQQLHRSTTTTTNNTATSNHNNSRHQQISSTHEQNTPTTPFTTSTTTTPTTQQTPSYSDSGYYSCRPSEASGGDSVSSNNSCTSTNNAIVDKPLLPCGGVLNDGATTTEGDFDVVYNGVHADLNGSNLSCKVAHKGPDESCRKKRYTTPRQDDHYTKISQRHNRSPSNHRNHHNHDHHRHHNHNHHHRRRHSKNGDGFDNNYFEEHDVIKRSNSRSHSNNHRRRGGGGDDDDGRFVRFNGGDDDDDDDRRSWRGKKVSVEWRDGVYNKQCTKDRPDYDPHYYSKEYSDGGYDCSSSTVYNTKRKSSHGDDCYNEYSHKRRRRDSGGEGDGGGGEVRWMDGNLHRRHDGKKRSKESRSKRKRRGDDDDDDGVYDNDNYARKTCRKCKDDVRGYCKEHRKHKMSKSKMRVDNHSKSSIIVIDDDDDEKDVMAKDKSEKARNQDSKDTKSSEGNTDSHQNNCSAKLPNVSSTNDGRNVEGEKERVVSLESRIQALLSPEKSVECKGASGSSSSSCHKRSGTNHTNGSDGNDAGGGDDDDDRMSISSGGAEANPIEVNALEDKKPSEQKAAAAVASGTTTSSSFHSSAATTSQSHPPNHPYNYPYNYPYQHTYPLPPQPFYHHHQQQQPPSFYPPPPPLLHPSFIHSYNPNYHNSSNMHSLYKSTTTTSTKTSTSSNNNNDNDDLNNDDFSDRSEFKAVLQAVTVDLQVAVSKDLRKKIVESMAYRMFDVWWDENSEKDASLLLKKNLLTDPIQSSTHQDGGLLGFRGSIALMPSFRKKPKVVTPPQSEEDKREKSSELSEEEEDEEDDEKGVNDDDGDDDDSLSGGVTMATAVDEMDRGSDEGKRDEEEGSDDDDDDERNVSEDDEPLMKKKRRRINDDDDDDDDDVSLSERSLSSGQESDDEDEGSADDNDEDEGSDDDDDKSTSRHQELKSSLDSESSGEGATNRLKTDSMLSRCRLFFPKQSAKPTDFHAEKKRGASQCIEHHKRDRHASSNQQPLLTDVTNQLNNNINHHNNRNNHYTDNYLHNKKSLKSRELLRLQCSLTPAYLTLTPDAFLPQPPSSSTFVCRSFDAESRILSSFVGNGMDAEDASYLKKSYEQLLSADYPETYWLNETHWADHPTTSPPAAPVSRKGRWREGEGEMVDPHKTGSARTEGYYKISGVDKMKYLRPIVSFLGAVEASEGEVHRQEAKNKVQNMSRHARSESRRLQTLLGEDYGDVMKINRLKFRKKDLKFGKSFIHDWGLYAREKIQEGELIIEYVGEVIRPFMADLREKRYEKSGIGSSYLFRIDADTIIDATKTGNMARFINHSCNPNCSVKIITVDSLKKIVIYSKRDIEVNDEITFDYKFPIEEDKIPCRCGSYNCRGTLN